MKEKKTIEPEIIAPESRGKKGNGAASAGSGLAVYDERPFFTQVWEHADEGGLLAPDFNKRFEREFGLLQNKYIKLRKLDIFDPTAMMDARTTVRNLLDIGLFLTSGGDRDKAATILAKGDFDAIARETLDRVKILRAKAREIRESSFLKIPPSANILKGAATKSAEPARVPLLWGASFIDPLLKESKLAEILPDEKFSLYDCINLVTTAFDRGESPYDDGRELNVVEKIFRSHRDLDNVFKALIVVESLVSTAKLLDWKEVFNLSGLDFERPQETHPFGWLRTATISLMISSIQESPSIIVNQAALEKFIQSRCNEFGEITDLDELAIGFVNYIAEIADLDELSEFILLKWATASAMNLEQITCEIQETVQIEGSKTIIQQFYNRFFIKYSRDEFFEFNIKPLSGGKELLLAQLAWAKSKSERKKVLDSVDIASLDTVGVTEFLHDAGKLAVEYIHKIPVESFTEHELLDIFAGAELPENALSALADEIFKRIDLAGWDISSIVELFQFLSKESKKKLKNHYKLTSKELISAVGNEYETDRLSALYALASPRQLFDLLIEFCDTPSEGKRPQIDSPNKKALLEAIKMLSSTEICEFFFYAEKRYREIFKDDYPPMSEFLRDEFAERRRTKPEFACKNLKALFDNLEKPVCKAVEEHFAERAKTLKKKALPQKAKPALSKKSAVKKQKKSEEKKKQPAPKKNKAKEKKRASRLKSAVQKAPRRQVKKPPAAKKRAFPKKTKLKKKK
ncbi:MAG: hypothetical protein Kow0090_15810 [Myxococcota bacterium]